MEKVGEKYMKTTEELREQVFNVLYDWMVAAGGDGDTLLCCDNWIQAADDFEEWLNIRDPGWLTRKDNADCVVFSDNQEGIVITNYDYQHPSWVDVVIKTKRI